MVLLSILLALCSTSFADYINIPTTGAGGGSVNSVGASAPLSSTGGTDPVISSSVAGSGSNGYLTSTDWNAFNNSWKLSGNAGSGGSILGTTDAVDLTIKTNGFNQMVMSQDGGWQSNQSFNLLDGTSKVQYYLSSAQVPTQNAPTSNRTSLGVNLEFDIADAGYDLGGSLLAQNARLAIGGSGTVSYGVVYDGTFDFSNAGTLNTFRGLNIDGSIGSGYTVGNFNGISSNLNTTGSTLTGMNTFSGSAFLTDVTAGNLFTQNMTLGLSGTSTVSQGVTGTNTNTFLEGSTNVTGSLIGSGNSVTMSDSSTANNITGSYSNVNMEDAASVNNITGVSSSVDITGTSDGGGISTINANTQVRGNATATGVTGVNIGSNITDDSVVQSYSGINASSNISGNADIDNVTMGFIGGNVQGAATIDNLGGFQASTVLGGTATTTNFTGGKISASISDTATSTNGISGLQVFVSTATPQSAVKGIDIDVSSASLTQTQIDAGAQIQALNVYGGSMSVQSNYNPPAAASFFQNHYIGGTSDVVNGAPISAYGFGTNLAQSINFHDDWTVDGSGVRLGYVDVGFVGAITGDTGKTMDSWTGALGGFGNPSGGAGVIDQAIMFRAAGGLPQGGSLSVTNMYGFQSMATLCAIGTNCWAFFDDSGSENFVSKLAIGTASKKVTSGVALDVVGRAAFTEGAQLTTSGTQPTCAVAYRGLLWNIEGGAGVADILQICQKNAADAYVWITK